MSRVYCTDRYLGKQFPRILADAGIVVERHGDLFQPDGSDEEWLEYCGTNRRIAVSHNSRIRDVPNELEAVTRFKVSLLIVVGKVTTIELAPTTSCKPFSASRCFLAITDRPSSPRCTDRRPLTWRSP